MLNNCGASPIPQITTHVFTSKILFSPPPCAAFPMFIGESEAPEITIQDALNIDSQVFGVAPILEEPTSGYKILILISDNLPSDILASTNLDLTQKTCTIGFHSSLLSNLTLLNSVLAHEFGHCFGYFHSDPNSGCLMAGLGGDGANCDYSELKPYLQTCGE